MPSIKPITSASDSESRRRMGTSQRSPSSRANKLQEPYSEGLPDDSTSTLATGSIRSRTQDDIYGA